MINLKCQILFENYCLRLYLKINENIELRIKKLHTIMSQYKEVLTFHRKTHL